MSGKLDRRYRVFVSSVGKLMDVERKTLREEIWDSGNIPIAMEGFSGNHEQMPLDVVEKNLSHADIVIFVLGYTYGSKIENQKCEYCTIKDKCNARDKRSKKCVISYTHFEYLYAKKHNILSYCITQNKIEDSNEFERLLITRKYSEEDTKNIREEYHKNLKKQKKLVEDAKRNWCESYDASSVTVPISQQIKQIFTRIKDRWSEDCNEKGVAGLIDAKAAMQRISELEEKLNENPFQWMTTLPETGITGTCIPFLYEPEQNKIITYLIANKAYKERNIMFPGGHAFLHEPDHRPEVIVCAKAEAEAGLKVKLINLNKRRSTTESAGHYYPRFSVLIPPHFTYHFEQEPNATKCYKNNNHKYHYDLVYICEITDVLSGQYSGQRRLKVELPLQKISQDDIKKFIQESITSVGWEVALDEYVLKMLEDAHGVYIEYLKSEGRM